MGTTTRSGGGPSRRRLRSVTKEGRMEDFTNQIVLATKCGVEFDGSDPSTKAKFEEFFGKNL